MTSGRIVGWGLAAAMLMAGPADAQSSGRDITSVDPAQPGVGIAIPTDNPELDLPELVGARQAIGSQLVDGQLPRPVVDYVVETGPVLQRISIFETGLVVVHVDTPGGRIQKKMILPPDAFESYRRHLSAADLARIRQDELRTSEGRNAVLRVYDPIGTAVERTFDPAILLPASLELFRSVLQDLLRAMTQDREVTNTVAGYSPAIGDHLVADDQRVYEVVRTMGDGKYLELRSVTDPTRIFISVADLHLRFVGSRRKTR